MRPVSNSTICFLKLSQVEAKLGFRLPPADLSQGFIGCVPVCFDDVALEFAEIDELGMHLTDVCWINLGGVGSRGCSPERFLKVCPHHYIVNRKT